MRMFVRAVVRLILVVLFMEIVLNAIRYIPSAIQIYNSLEMGNSYLYELFIVFGAHIIGLVVLFLLWVKTDWLVRVLTGRVYDRELIISTSNVDLMKVAMRILGLYLLVDTIPLLLGIIGYYIATPDRILIGDNYNANLVRNIIVPLVKILLGIWLVLGTKGISRLVTAVDDKVHMIQPEEKQE